MKPKVITLAEGERIVAVVCENASGPGWSNTPTWVHIGTNDGRLRSECIQPAEGTLALWTLFEIAERMHRALIAAVPVKRK